MKKLSPRTTGLLVGLGAVVAAVAIPLAISSALPPGTPAAGTITLNPPTGTSDSTFNLVFGTPPAPQSCPGDATASYRWSTFITPASNDAGAMIYTPSGTPSGA